MVNDDRLAVARGFAGDTEQEGGDAASCREHGAEEGSSQKRSDRDDTPRAQILIADDEPMIRELVLMTLAQRGWEAQSAATGAEAVRLCADRRFDVVLMDLQMPEMDGLEATRRIRAGENGRKTCIVGLTAHARPEVRQECLAAGMDMVLTKPVRMKDLYSAVAGCIEE